MFTLLFPSPVTKDLPVSENGLSKDTNVTAKCYNCVIVWEHDQIIPNKLHGPMHYKIGVTCVFIGHVF